MYYLWPGSYIPGEQKSPFWGSRPSQANAYFIPRLSGFDHQATPYISEFLGGKRDSVEIQLYIGHLNIYANVILKTSSYGTTHEKIVG